MDNHEVLPIQVRVYSSLSLFSSENEVILLVYCNVLRNKCIGDLIWTVQLKLQETNSKVVWLLEWFSIWHRASDVNYQLAASDRIHKRSQEPFMLPALTDWTSSSSKMCHILLFLPLLVIAM